MSIRHLDRLLLPRSVAVLGASHRPGAIGTRVWQHLRAGGFAGPVHPVNLKHARLDGLPVFARVADLPAAPDLALICTPARTVARLVAELGAAGCRAAVIVGTGLSAAEQQAALDAARPHLLRLLGPDSLGVLSPHIGLACRPGPRRRTAGRAGLHLAVRRGGQRDAGLGRQPGASACRTWCRWASTATSIPATCSTTSRATAAPAPSCSMSNRSPSPRKFMSAARAAARNKPVIVVKAGRAGPGPAGRGLAHRRPGRLRHRLSTPPSAAPACCGWTTLQELFMAAATLARFRAQPRRGADHPRPTAAAPA